MKKHRWVAVFLACLMVFAMAVPAAGAETAAELPAWQQPFEETVTLDVVIGWDADPSIKEGTTPETNALRTVAKDLFNIELNFLWLVPNDQYSDKLALQLSSGDMPDILMLDLSLIHI